MPVSVPTYKSLADECRREVESTNKVFPDTTPYRIGEVSDFDPQELEYPPENCKIFISYGVVYSHSGCSPIHGGTLAELTSTLLFSMKNRYGWRNVTINHGTGLSIMNVNECHATFGKIPDDTILIGSNGARGSERVVVEVAYRHENLDLLLREAEVLLNQYTRVSYALLVGVFFLEDILCFRFFLCTRRNNKELEKLQNEFTKRRTWKCTEYSFGLTERDKFGPSRHSDSDSRSVSGRDLENYYQIIILHDQTVSHDNLQPVTLTFLDEFPFVGTSLEETTNGYF